MPHWRIRRGDREGGEPWRTGGKPEWRAGGWRTLVARLWRKGGEPRVGGIPITWKGQAALLRRVVSWGAGRAQKREGGAP